MRKPIAAALAAAFVVTAVPGLAQNTTDPAATTADPAVADTTMATPVEDDDDDDFPWGLLGLLGLLGLAGRRRADVVHVDRTDARRP